MTRTVSRTVLLTGIGKAGQVGETVAAAFAAAGDHVILVARDLAESRARAGALAHPAGGVSAYAADLADDASTAALAREVAQEHGGRLDAVVHMAGGWRPGSRVADATLADWNRMISINLLTAAAVAHAFAPHVRAARGAFVFFASEAALPGADIAGMGPYAVAKLGVAALARALAAEERRHGVRANALAPASIRTASNEDAMGADVPYVERDEVAATVLWLCSHAASAVSGELIHLAAQQRHATPP